MKETSVNSRNGRQTEHTNFRKLRQEEKKRKKRRIITFIILQIISTCLILGYAYVYRKYSQIQRIEFSNKNVINNDISVENIKKMEGYWNIAVFGVDSRNSSVGKGNHADVIMIVSINRSNGDIKLMSIYRDSYLDTGKKLFKMNNAYFEGGPEQAVRALNRNLDLNITDYVTVSWKAVATAINILGGVDIDITKPEFRYINGYITETVKSTGIGSVQLKKYGQQHLDGIQAVAYARLRYMDTDYERTERQKRVLKQAFEKAKNLNLQTLNQMADILLPMVATNLEWQDALGALGDLKRYKIVESSGFPQKRAEAMMGKKGWVIIPRNLEENVKILHEFLFGTTDYKPSKTLKNIEARIDEDYKLYKNGAFKVEKASTEETVEKETEKETKKSKILYETDENGETIYITETDESDAETSKAKPGESGTETSKSRHDESLESRSTTEPEHTRETEAGPYPAKPTDETKKPTDETKKTVGPTSPTKVSPADETKKDTSPTRSPGSPTENITTVPVGPRVETTESNNISPGMDTTKSTVPRNPAEEVTRIEAGGPGE